MHEQYGQMIYLITLMDLGPPILMLLSHFKGPIIRINPYEIRINDLFYIHTPTNYTLAPPPEENLNGTGPQECICSERFARSAGLLGRPGPFATYVGQPSSISAWPIW